MKTFLKLGKNEQNSMILKDKFLRNQCYDKIQRYYHDCYTPNCRLFLSYSYVKYRREDQKQLPKPLAELIEPRLAPTPTYQASSPFADTRRDFVLPRDAPRTIATIADLITAFDSIPPLCRDLMIEMKFILNRSTAPHRAYEAVREFAIKHFADDRQLAALLVLHLPARGGADRSNHIHLFVPARQLTADGFGANAGTLVHDKGFVEAAIAWKAWSTSQV